jgi:hypothetical protein
VDIQSAIIATHPQIENENYLSTSVSTYAISHNRCHHNMISLTLKIVDVEISRKQEQMKENINL